MSRQEDFKRMSHSHDTESSKYEQQCYIDGDVVEGEITSPLKSFRAPKSIVFPIKEANNETE